MQYQIIYIMWSPCSMNKNSNVLSDNLATCIHQWRSNSIRLQKKKANELYIPRMDFFLSLSQKTKRIPKAPSTNEPSSRLKLIFSYNISNTLLLSLPPRFRVISTTHIPSQKCRKISSSAYVSYMRILDMVFYACQQNTTCNLQHQHLISMGPHSTRLLQRLNAHHPYRLPIL